MPAKVFATGHKLLKVNSLQNRKLFIYNHLQTGIIVGLIFS